MATYTNTGSKLTVRCDDEAERTRMIAALVSAGWACAEAQFPGLVLMPTGKPKQIAKAENALVSAGATKPVAKAAGYRHRVLRLAQSVAFTPTTVQIEGETLSLTGHGKTFIGDELDGPLWGEAVCYAYYA